jgi:hypothetical protein
VLKHARETGNRETEATTLWEQALVLMRMCDAMAMWKIIEKTRKLEAHPESETSD